MVDGVDLRVVFSFNDAYIFEDSGNIIYFGVIVAYICKFELCIIKSIDLNCTINDSLCYIWICYFDYGYFWSCYFLII